MLHPPVRTRFIRRPRGKAMVCRFLCTTPKMLCPSQPGGRRSGDRSASYIFWRDWTQQSGGLTLSGAMAAHDTGIKDRFAGRLRLVRLRHSGATSHWCDDRLRHSGARPSVRTRFIRGPRGEVMACRFLCITTTFLCIITTMLCPSQPGGQRSGDRSASYIFWRDWTQQSGVLHPV